MTVAALYVDPKGVYAGLPDVEVWDEARDARTYAGPWAVVAHPPCARWSIMGACRGYRDGADGGCFAAALAAVRRFGGVLEHPRYSLAWSRFRLARPSRYGWTRSLLDDGWTCEVDQRLYGHRTNKPTWLYYVGNADPPPLRWGRGPKGKIPIHNSYRGGGTDRSGTPPRFRDELLAMARSGSPSGRGSRSDNAATESADTLNGWTYAELRARCESTLETCCTRTSCLEPEAHELAGLLLAALLRLTAGPSRA